MFKTSKWFPVFIGLTLILAAQASAQTVSLAWDANTETDLAGYRIYYAAGSTTQPVNGTGAVEGASPVDVGLATTATLTGLSDTQTYSIAVTAYTTDGLESDFSNVVTAAAPPPPSNRAPVLSGTPGRQGTAGMRYTFTPTAQDPDSGDTLEFSISNIPDWARFDTSTGTLSGTPGEADTGWTRGIVIRVSDGQLSASLPAFDLEIVPAPERDTDGDGIADSTDTDDDNDGVIDSRDSAPEDPTLHGWAISAQAASGGYLIPSGEVLVDYGQPMTFTATPMQGYLLEELLVDGIPVGTAGTYTFPSVTATHHIEARFAPITSGFGVLPDDTGIPGVSRADGGLDADNLVSGRAKADLDFVFRTVLQDPDADNPLQVFVLLDGYAYSMPPVAGDIATGATYATRLQLGPVPDHHFHFEARDLTGTVIWRYPSDGEIAGPQIVLPAGKKLLGAPTDRTRTTTGLTDLLGHSAIYRWQSGGLSTNLNSGSYTALAAGEMLHPGEGYIIQALPGETLDSHGAMTEPSSAETATPLQPGWNLIANPYTGAVPLGDLALQKNGAPELSWAEAVANDWVVGGFYRYLGDEWGEEYAFVRSEDSPAAASLLPWEGYWLYLAADDGDYVLLMPRPAR